MSSVGFNSRRVGLMTKLQENIEIVLAHESADTRKQLSKLLTELEYTIRETCTTTEELLAACLPETPDLIISGIEMRGGNAVDALVRISQHDPTPAIVVTPEQSLSSVEEALRDHVMAYLVEPIDPAQIKPTIYLVCERFREFELLKAENDDLKQTLADRKVIERAKGIVMGQYELSEDDAFRKLQEVAKSQRMKLVKVAAAMIEATERDAN